MTEQETSLLFQISKDLATNTESTKGIEKHLATLNSKVATLESRAQQVEGANLLTANAIDKLQTAIQKMDEAKKESKSIWMTWLDRILWGVVIIICMLFYQLLLNARVINDFLK